MFLVDAFFMFGISFRIAESIQLAPLGSSKTIGGQTYFEFLWLFCFAGYVDIPDFNRKSIEKAQIMPRLILEKTLQIFPMGNRNQGTFFS